MAPSTIRVYARIKSEITDKPANYEIGTSISTDYECLKISNLSKKGISQECIFKFNKIFKPYSTQEDVFSKIAKPLIEKVFMGINATIFAYGATGSGKTHALTGSQECHIERGIIPRTIEYIFKNNQDRNTFMFYISYLEIYNENAFDLLSPQHQVTRLEELPRVIILEDENGEAHYKNLCLKEVHSEKEALCLLYTGESHRMIAETPLNNFSSRSHCVFTVHVISKSTNSGQNTRSKLNLVDLAGSERVHRMNLEGMTLNEARLINLSLHYLERVIHALSQKRKNHVPYRNSLMTFILRDSLGGNCLTAMLATMSLTQANIEETLSTCKFAQRVSLVKYEANVNFIVTPEEGLGNLKTELKRMQRDLYENDNPTLQLTKGEPTKSRQDIEKNTKGSIRNHYVEQTKFPETWVNKCNMKSIEQIYQELVDQKDKEIEMLINLYEDQPTKGEFMKTVSEESFLHFRNDIAPFMRQNFKLFLNQTALKYAYYECVQQIRNRHTAAEKLAQLMMTKHKQIELMKQTIKLGTQNGSELKVKLIQEQTVYRELLKNVQSIQQNMWLLKEELSRVKLKLIEDFKRSPHRCKSHTSQTHLAKKKSCEFIRLVNYPKPF